jgi:hypothetical protein
MINALMYSNDKCINVLYVHGSNWEWLAHGARH